jgi:hypothetical protein
MFSTRERPTSPAAADVVSEPEEDKTTAFSVATLRDLVARTAEDAAATPPPPPSHSKPMFLEKSGAILVLPETPAPAPVTAPVAAPVPTPAPAPVREEPISRIQSVSAIEREHLAAPAFAGPAFAAPAVVVARRPRRATHRAARPRAPYTVWQFLRCRLIALGLLALVVASQPWWWDIGSLSVHAPAPTSANTATP